MLGTFVNFGTDFQSSTLGIAGTLVSDFSPYIQLVVGVLLGIVVIVLIIRAMVHHG